MLLKKGVARFGVVMLSLAVIGCPGKVPMEIDPIANFGWLPASPTTGQAVSFTDASTDADGTIVSWSWTFTGGNPSTSTAQNPTATWATAGTFDVTLSVTDDDGLTDTVSKQVTLVDATPIIESLWWEVPGPGYVWIPEVIPRILHVIAHGAPDATLTYLWESISEAGPSFNPNGTGDADTTWAYVWFEFPGIYEVKVTVSDGDNTTSGTLSVPFYP